MNELPEKNEVSMEVFKNLIEMERMHCMREWLNEWGYSVRDCLKEQSDMFKPCVAQLEKILDGLD